MAQWLGSLIDRLRQRWTLRRWTRAADRAVTDPLVTLKAQRSRGRLLRRQIDRLLYIADSRLSLPLIGSNAIRKPMGSDWVWRPQLWRGPIHPPGAASVESKFMIGDEVTVFHDCRVSELTLRQIRNLRESDLAPFGLRLDQFRFDGSFLSLVIDLPGDVTHGLTRRHLVRMDVIVQMEKPLEIFARLNIRYGPNTEQIVRELPLQDDDRFVEFDLAYTKLNEKRVEKLWLDLIFEGPEMNQIILRDITFSRHPRAEL